jgi:hypothetical protein
MTFDEVVNRLWKAARLGHADPDLREVEEALEASIPGEDRVVDGFYDAVAQYVGGIAVAAISAMRGDQSHYTPETNVFDLLRMILSEMRLSRLEPGSVDPEGLQFENSLHLEPAITEEAEFWSGLIDMLSKGASIDDVRKFATAHVLRASRFEPELSEGLQRDTGDL